MNLTWHIGGKPAHPATVAQIGTEGPRTARRMKMRPRPHRRTSKRTLKRIVGAVAGGLDTRNIIAAEVGMEPYDVGWRLNYLKKRGDVIVVGRSVDARWRLA